MRLVGVEHDLFVGLSLFVSIVAAPSGQDLDIGTVSKDKHATVIFSTWLYRID